MKKLLLLWVLLLSCEDSERTIRVLTEAGYTNIQTMGWSRHCGQDDDYCTEFVATSPGHRRVSGAVGCGWDTGCSKGCTIRLN